VGTDDTSARADDEAASVAELFVPLGEEASEADDEPEAPRRPRFRGVWLVAVALAVVPVCWALVRA